MEQPAPEPQKRGCLPGFILTLAAIFVIAAGLRYLSPLLAASVQPPAPTPTPPRVSVSSLQNVAELATIRYRTIAEVQGERIPADIRQKLGGKEQMLMLVYGDVTAGFDLSQLGPDDLWTDGTRVQLHLPAPQILNTSIDFDATHIVHYERSFFVGNDPALQAELLASAQTLMAEAALEAGVLDLAAQFGQVFFENYLRSLGFTDIRIAVN